MKRILILGTFLFPVAAMAQTPPQQFTLTVTAPEIQIIGTALAQRPFGEVNELVAKLNAQIKEQSQPAPEKAQDHGSKKR